MNNTFYLPLIFKALEIISLVFFGLATLLAIRDIFAEEELNLHDSIKEIIASLLAFVIFFSLSNQVVNTSYVIQAFSTGVAIGFVTSFFIKLGFKKSQWLTKGSLVFLIIWVVILILSEISEQIFENIEWWWILLAVFGISMMIGEVINIVLRKKFTKLRGQKK